MSEYIVRAQPSLNVRIAPALDAPIITTLPYGCVVRAMPSSAEGWLALQDGTGYISARFVEPVDYSAVRYVTASALRIRRAPSRAAPVVDVLPYGTAVTVKPRRMSGWLELADGRGFVAADYLSVEPPPRRLMLGVNIDPDNPVGAPTADEVRPLKYVRYVYAAHGMDVRARLDRYARLIQTYRDAGITTVLVLNHQTWGEGRGYNWEAMSNDAAAWWAFTAPFVNAITPVIERMGEQVVYQIWNEGDQASKAAVGMPPLAYAHLLDAVVTRIRAVAPRAQIISQGHVSGDPRYWRIVQSTSTLANTLSGVAVHPYGIGGGALGWLGTVRDVVRAWRTITFTPLWFTEFGVCGGNAPDLPESIVAAYAQSFLNQAAACDVAVALWYGYANGMDNCRGLVQRGFKGALWRVFAQWR